MKFTKVLSIFLTLLIVSNFQSALADVGLEVKGGTMGVGGGLVLGLASHANLRLGAQKYEISADFTEDGLEYKAEFKPDNQYLLLDLMPFENGNLRLTVGTIKNDNEIVASATVQSSTNIGGSAISLGRVDSVIGFNSSASYLGIGWGNAVRPSKRIGFTVDLGIMNQGSPIARLTVDDPSNTVTQADIDQEAADLEEELKDFKMYPVLALGLTVRF